MDLPRAIGLMGPPPRPGGRPGVSAIRPGLLVGEYPLPEDAAWLRAEHESPPSSLSRTTRI